MRRCLVGVLLLVLAWGGSAQADERDKDGTVPTVETIEDAVRVTVVKAGGETSVRSVSGGTGGQQGCVWTVVYVDDLDDATYGMSAGPKPHPEARLALLLCNGTIVQPVWIAPSDVVDLDAAAADAAQRYVEEVLEPVVGIGANPDARGLVGLDSWFWIEGFDGSVSAPPITAFGVSIEVRMSSGTVVWDFGDGVVTPGDLGRAYPEESTVRHTHQRDGTYAVVATIALVPEYRIDGGPWLTLPALEAVATRDHPVEAREAVVTET